jgi:hypothetical protein
MLHLFFACSSLVDAILIYLLTVDGPGLHPVDANSSVMRYPSLSPRMPLYVGRVIVNVPLCTAAALLAWNLVMYPATQKIARYFHAAELLGSLAFIVSFGLYLGSSSPYQVVNSLAADIFLFLEFCKLAWFYSLLYFTFPEIQAVAMSIRNGVELIMVPIYLVVFLVISFGTAVYFLEPCFDASNCPWRDLALSSFWGIVTLSSVGYGAQQVRVIPFPFLSLSFPFPFPFLSLSYLLLAA